MMRTRRRRVIVSPRSSLYETALRRRHRGQAGARGGGITGDAADELLESLDLLTSGNHTWAKREINGYLDRPGARQLRPANYPGDAPGRGDAVLETASGVRLGVINLEGRVFMKP